MYACSHDIYPSITFVLFCWCACITSLVHQQGAGIQSESVPLISTAEMVVVGQANWLCTDPPKICWILKPETGILGGVMTFFPQSFFGNISKKSSLVCLITIHDTISL